VIQTLELRDFKCFTRLKLELSNVTVLAGVNAAGKSTVIQALVLLHQALAEGGSQGERHTALPLLGSLVSVGSVREVINQSGGARSFGIALTADLTTLNWSFGRGDDGGALDAKVVDLHWGRAGKAAELLPPAAIKACSALVELIKTLKYVPADRVGPAEVYPLLEAARHRSLGPRAERAVGVLHWQGRDLDVREKLRHPDPTVVPKLLEQTQAYLRDLFPQTSIEVVAIPGANLVTLGVRTRDDQSFHRPPNVGFGITYTLPIVVALLSAGPGGLVVLENPEAHLHPRAQVQLARLIAKYAASGGQVLLETHSDHIINALRVAVAKHTLEPSQVALHWLEPDPDSGAIEPRRIHIDPRGRLSERPEGFFDEIERQLGKLYDP
jgi:predicted ATPase